MFINYIKIYFEITSNNQTVQFNYVLFNFYIGKNKEWTQVACLWT